MTDKVDRIGAVASTVCALHCAICAFLPAAFGLLGVGFLLGHEIEWLFTLVAIAFALGALVLGWRQHRSLKVAGLLALGIVGLLASRGLEMGSDHHGHDEKASHSKASQADVKSEAGHDTSSKMVKTKTGMHRDDHDDKHPDGHEDGHGDGHGDHDELGHLVGASVGVIGGFILFVGHLSNLRATRRSREDCC